MNTILQEKLSLFAENVGEIRNNFIWQEASAKRMAALIYTIDGKHINTDAIRESHRMIKDEVGAFSTFRGNLSIYIAAALSLVSNPHKLLADTLHIYDLLKAQGFWASDYLVVAAFEIAVNTDNASHSNIVSRTRAFYDEMKANHRFHIGQDDYIFAAMLALSDIDPHAGAVKMKRVFQHIRGEFSAFIGKGSMLTLAQMMVLGGSTEDCVANLTHLSRILRKHKIKLDKAYTLASLGVLGLLDTDHYVLANEIAEARDFLRGQKGFGHFSITTQELLLYAVSLITIAHADNCSSGLVKAGIATSVTNLIIAQQVALIVAMSAATTAAASSSC